MAPVPHHMSSEEFRRRASEIVDFIVAYHEGIAQEAPVMSRARPGEILAQLPGSAPESGEPWDAILGDAMRIIPPGLTNWQSPNFHGFFPANATYASILGELMSAGLAVQGMVWQTSPACTEIEVRMLDWFGEAIGLPGAFLSGAPNGGGVIQGTASEAVLVAMVAARRRAVGASATAPVGVYCSYQAHSSVVKAAMIAGIGAENVRKIPTTPELAMDPGALRAALDADVARGIRPALVVATLGTTSTGAMDPLRPLGELAAKHGAWLHVDAAWAGSAAVCPEFRGMMDGVELAHSFSFNPHKWLLTNFDCALFWTTDRRSLIDALSITPEYLRNAASDAGAVIDYRDWQIPLGRRFRAIKLWFVMRHYGVDGLRAHIREHVRIAGALEGMIRRDDRFEIPVPRSLTLMCVRLRAGDEATRGLLERVNQSGKAFLSHTVVPVGGQGGRPTYLIRIALGSARTQDRHAAALWELMRSLV